MDILKDLHNLGHNYDLFDYLLEHHRNFNDSIMSKEDRFSILLDNLSDCFEDLFDVIDSFSDYLFLFSNDLNWNLNLGMSDFLCSICWAGDILIMMLFHNLNFFDDLRNLDDLVD